MASSNPKPDGERIKKLMERVESGDIKIPKFQRNYVWKQKDILELLDSLHKGYPIGSLLFWRTNTKLKGERNIGGYDLPDTAESYPTNYVLDGQQRLTTIYSVFANRTNHPGMSEVFNINYELYDNKFVPSIQATPDSIPLHALFDNKLFHSITRELDAEPAGRAADVQEIFMNYEVPIVTIFNMDIQEVSTIFERINSTGKHLTIFDLMVAATWSEEFDLRDQIDSLKHDLEDKNYGDLDEVTVLKCLAAVITDGQDRKGIIKLKEKENELKTGLQKTRYGLLRAVDFLSTELSVPSYDFLPYDFQLVLLTYFFSKISLPSNFMLNNIKRWFWRSSFTERYQGASETLLEGDLNDCKKLITGETEDLFNFNIDIPTQKIMRTEFKRGTAFSNAIIALLASQHPKNLVTGTIIDVTQSLSSYNRKEFHHIFPRGFLKNKNIQYSPNSVCNIVILSSQENKKIGSKAPTEYFAEIRHSLGPEYESVLKSNIIPYDQDSGLFQNDYEFFIELRADMLINKIKSIT